MSTFTALIFILLISAPFTLFARDSKTEKELRATHFWSLIVYIDMVKLSCRTGECATEALGWLERSEAEFHKIASRFKNQNALQARIDTTKNALERRQSGILVLKETELLTSDLFASLDEKPIPTETPNWESGRVGYSEHCAQCHGETGLGNGPLSSRLKVKPTNLIDPMSSLLFSPASVYAAVSVGVPYSDMPGFKDILPKSKMWSVAFYVLSMPFSDATVEDCSLNIDLETITLASNRRLKNGFDFDKTCKAGVSQIRRFTSFDPATARSMSGGEAETNNGKKWARYWSGISFALVLALFLLIFLRVRR